jgi:hypothetical protein
VGLAAAVAVVCAGCSVLSPAPASSTALTGSGGAPISAPSTTPTDQVALPTVTAITPSDTAGTPDGVPAAAPAPDTSAATYANPVTVTTAWMQQFCQTDYQEPINGNVTRAAVFATPAGTAADLAAGDTPTSYQQVVAQKLSSRCSNVTAQLDPEGPSGPNEVYVEVSASQTQLADGSPFEVLPLTSTRRVLRGADGRWLVDIAEDAG